MAGVAKQYPPVTVEYDCRGKRVTKTFDDAYEGRRFFVAKDKAGKRPKVTKEQETQDMAKKATTKKKATSETAPTKKRNLRFVAGQVVKTAGLKKANADSFEITEEMAAELAKLYGEDDLKKCRGVLVLARACIAGYLS